jgi:hypothetical protein
MVRKKIESKKKIDTGVQSKTARASMAKGKKQEGFIASGEMDRVIPLCGGQWIYLLDPRDGHTHHLNVGSNKYNSVVSALLESTHGSRIQSELSLKGFPVPEVENA